MTGKLKDEIKKRRAFASPEQEAFLNLRKTADVLVHEIDAVLEAEGLSGTQYNVLRILRGAGPGGLGCGEIAGRMITRDPDITRLLDRLERRGLVTRGREAQDRRVICTRITDAGLAALSRLDEPVNRAHRKQLGHLGPQKLKQLTELLELARRRDTGHQGHGRETAA